ncbi:putative ribonuclease H-like domain-containing protein [Tanacetum coccineum]
MELLRGRDRSLIEGCLDYAAVIISLTYYFLEEKTVHIACAMLSQLMFSDDGFHKTSCDDGRRLMKSKEIENECNDQEKEDNVNSTNNVNAAGTNKVNVVVKKYNEDDGHEADMEKFEIQHPKEGIDYDEVFAPVARIEAIRLFLVYASFKDFVVYQMNVKNSFLYGKIEKEVLLMHEKFQMSSMGELTLFLGLRVKQKKDSIFISQDKYVEEILKKFRFTEVNIASTPMETQKPLLKDEDGEEVDVHMYCVPVLDTKSIKRKSTTGGCQFLGCRLISWQCAETDNGLQILQQKLSMWLLQGCFVEKDALDSDSTT